MSGTRLTRQGVRALDPVGHNGHRATKTHCPHNFNGTLEVIGTRWVMEDGDIEAWEQPVYGHRCLFGCGATRSYA